MHRRRLLKAGPPITRASSSENITPYQDELSGAICSAIHLRTRQGSH
jgi:hypothetical protein